jgi:hypothetical protein
MNIKRSGAQPSAKGLAEYFTGTVGIDPWFEAQDSSDQGDRLQKGSLREPRTPDRRGPSACGGCRALEEPGRKTNTCPGIV